MNILIFVTNLFLIVLCVYGDDPCKRAESVDVTAGEKYDNGSIVHEGVEYIAGTWYQGEENNMTVILGCPCIGRVCLWKCCGPNQARFIRDCSDTNQSVVNPFSPTVYKGDIPSGVVAHEHFFYMYTQTCEDRYMADSNNSYEELYIQENGTLLELARGRPQWHLPNRYCVDMMFNEGSDESRLIAAVCYPETASTDDSPYLYIAYAAGLLLSVPFLLATFLVYAFIPELRNLHGMCLMAYCAGLITAYPLLAYLKVHIGEVGVGKTECLVFAFIIYYAFQTSFFWLNVMCFDIWRTFSGYRGGSTNKRRERKRFALYGAYAWGIPAVLTAYTVTMQFVGEVPDYVIKPRFGERRCWFDNWLSELVYFFAPVLVLVACNITLFSITAHRIRSIKQETAILKSAESARSDRLKKDKQRYGLYVKLFIVMGVNWAVELISFAVGGSNWYWVVVDISNIILGFFIFFIFVWKNKVRNLVRKRLTGKRGIRSVPDSGTNRWNTRSSYMTDDTRITSTNSNTEETAVRLKDLH